MSQQRTPIYRKDYQPPAYVINQVFLCVDLFDDITHISATMQCEKNSADDVTSPLILNGKDLTLVAISVDDKMLTEADYRLTDDTLIIPNLGNTFSLRIENTIKPQENSSLEGLYQSKGMFCTQCEAQGFRKITYYLDRPDVMATFKVKISADKKRYPVLLSNGNRIESGDMEDSRHFMTYEDPFKKPAYLFALVAGDLAIMQDTFTTQSGRNIALEFYASAQDINKCAHAMACLKKAMRWDETVYQREYDLDTYMVVAVADFNMGAMENKGLNIFNTSCVLANPKTATDTDYEYILRVIGHEYFHNWTGNRITLRDWFQLSLKEGLTVFRDQCFTEDHTSKTVKRIDDATLIRTQQFSEDASPMRHPVRPDAYIEMDNFYTSTVYYKGAEVIRMLKTMVGDQGFYDGMARYFSRHDGQAVTCDAFIRAFEDANNLDLSPFMRWYAQDSTPTVSVSDDYDADTQTYQLHFKQTCPASHEQPQKKPFTIPIKIGFHAEDGHVLSASDGTMTQDEFIVVLEQEQHTVTFSAVKAPPIPSLLRDFSAPVKLAYPYTEKALMTLIRHDSNAFNRYEAAQQYIQRYVQQYVAAGEAETPPQPNPDYAHALGELLTTPGDDLAFVAKMLTIPAMNDLVVPFDSIALDHIASARQQLTGSLETHLHQRWLETYHQLTTDAPFTITQKSVHARSLKNTCLGLLSRHGSEDVMALCQHQFHHANNMTDQLAALQGLLYSQDQQQKEAALLHFFEQWQHEPLVINKWFSLQACFEHPDTLDNVKKCLRHPSFDPKNPNNVRALLGSFSQRNMINFHQSDGQGYAFITEQIIHLDKINAHVSASLVRSMMQFKRFDANRQKHMREQLETILNTSPSANVYEIVSKSLAE